MTLNYLKDYRVDKGMRQEDLAKASGISQVTISYIENNLSEPMYLTKVRLAQALNIGLEIIFPDSEQAMGKNRLLYYRGKRKLSQRELGKTSGVSQVTISFIENLQTEPMENTKKKLAKALEVDMNKLFPPAPKLRKKTTPLSCPGR